MDWHVWLPAHNVSFLHDRSYRMIFSWRLSRPNPPPTMRDNTVKWWRVITRFASNTTSFSCSLSYGIKLRYAPYTDAVSLRGFFGFRGHLSYSPYFPSGFVPSLDYTSALGMYAALYITDTTLYYQYRHFLCILLEDAFMVRFPSELNFSCILHRVAKANCHVFVIDKLPWKQNVTSKCMLGNDLVINIVKWEIFL